MTYSPATALRTLRLAEEVSPDEPGAATSDLPAACRAALSVLLEAYDLAGDVERNKWDFAIEIGPLRELGVNDSQFRWLTCKGLVEHGREATAAGQIARSFHSLGGLTFWEDTSFVLSAEGVEFARRILSVDEPPPATAPRQGKGSNPTAPVRPKWDRLRQELRVGDVVVKQFKVPAANQERILAALEEEGWPCRLDDPLPPQRDQDSKRRLHDTINSLNRNQKHPLIRFLGDGSGQGIRWELASSAGEARHAGNGDAPEAS